MFITIVIHSYIYSNRPWYLVNLFMLIIIFFSYCQNASEGSEQSTNHFLRSFCSWSQRSEEQRHLRIFKASSKSSNERKVQNISKASDDSCILPFSSAKGSAHLPCGFGFRGCICVDFLFRRASATVLFITLFFYILELGQEYRTRLV